MAIAKMCRAEFVCARSDKLSLLNFLQEKGVASIEEDASLAEALKEKNLQNDFEPLHFKVHEYKVFADLMSVQRRPEEVSSLLSYTVSRKTLEELVLESMRWQQRIERMLKVLNPLSDEKKPLFAKRREISLDERYMNYQEQVEIHEALIEAEEVHENLLRSEQNLAGLKTHAKNLAPWKDLSLPRLKDNAYVMAGLGYFDRPEDYEKIKLLAEEAELVLATDEYFTSEDGAIAVLLAWPREQEDKARRVIASSALRSFPAATDVERKGDFVKAYEQQQKRIESAEEDIEEAREGLKKQASRIRDFEWLYDVLTYDLEKLRALLKVGNSEMLSAFSGYIPASAVPEFSRQMNEQFAVITAFSQPEEDDEEVPTLLVNPDPVTPIESVINTFSPPNYRVDTDPAFIMSMTYAFFFGSMLSDIGYGLLLLIGCLVLLYKFKAEGGLRQMLHVFAAGGAMAIVFGILYGSFFGDLLPTLSNGKVNLPALWFDPMDEPINLMIYSVVFGAVHLFIGMGFDIKNKLRAGEWHDALFSVAPWYLIITGIGLMALGVPFAPIVTLAGAAILMFLSPRGKNPIKRLISGLGALYGITSWLGDLLSYTRILALTLATSVIAMVVNLMAKMVGTSGPALVFLVIILAFGHALNLALSTLSAYVHATRLHYVEFFGKFYVGGGKLFKPFAFNGNYTRVTGAKPLAVGSDKAEQ